MPERPPATVKPRVVKGFRDILPHQAAARRRVIETIRAAFERYGFVPLDTPAVEYVDALLGLGEEGSKNLFRFTSPDGEEIALRYDLTVPLARVVAQYRDLPRPFRRYQVSPVWRADKPDPGRFREFVQFDIDSVGVPTVLADAEIVMAMDEALCALRLDFRVRYSSRKLLNSILRWAGVPEGRSMDTMRVLDKFDKIGLEDLLRELGPGRTDASGDRIRGLGLPDPAVMKLREFYETHAVTDRAPGGGLDALTRLFEAVPGSGEAVAELGEMERYLRIAKIPPARVGLDTSLARGLDYYTGLIFEATLSDLPRFGAIFGGGRYDGLVSRFGEEAVPATGASIGVDRLVAAMEELGRVPKGWAVARVMMTVMDPERMPDYLALTREVREAGIPAEIYLGDAKSLKKQFAYADRMGIPVVLIAGSNEFEAGTVSMKELSEGRRGSEEAATRDAWVKQRSGQQTVSRSEMIPVLKRLLEVA